jgi:hypothetical protein
MSDDDTPAKGVEVLPGYDVGFRDGYRLAKTRILHQYRRLMVASGASQNDAMLWENGLREWLEAHGG